jgi:C4-dicarboxylate-specific signal transduction histidine kinase
MAAAFAPLSARYSKQLRSKAATGAVAVFGEMVALLWHEGKHQAAIRLEQLWNEFCEAQPLRLRCAYPLGEFSRNDPEQQLQQVCGEHSHIVSSESFSALATEQQRLRSVAVLQQKADALDSVLAERASLALALAEEVDELRRLHELSTKVSWLDLQHVMREVVAAVAALHKTDMGLLALHHAERRELQLEASIGFSPRFLEQVSRVPPGAGGCGVCLERGQPVIVEDVETDPVFEGYREAARSAGFRAVYSTPLLDRGGRLVGVLSLHFREPHRPGEREIRLTDLYTRLAGAAIENARLSRALLQAEKLAATGRMAATIAHEINNPLESVVNLLYILRSYVRDEAAARHYLSLAESELSRVSQITKQTLGFYRERQARARQPA